MDDRTFDRMTRWFATDVSRRRTVTASLGGAIAALLGPVGLGGRDATVALADARDRRRRRQLRRRVQACRRAQSRCHRRCGTFTRTRRGCGRCRGRCPAGEVCRQGRCLNGAERCARTLTTAGCTVNQAAAVWECPELAPLAGADLRPCGDLSGAILENVDLSSANLSGVNVSDADLRRANLFNANLLNTTLNVSNLFDANLRQADLRGAFLRGTTLFSTTLFAANLQDVDLTDADLRFADLQSANLVLADLEDTDLRSADLRFANVSNADLSSVNWGNTICPDQSNSDDNGDTCCDHLNGEVPAAGC